MRPPMVWPCRRIRKSDSLPRSGFRLARRASAGAKRLPWSPNGRLPASPEGTSCFRRCLPTGGVRCASGPTAKPYGPRGADRSSVATTKDKQHCRRESPLRDLTGRRQCGLRMTLTFEDGGDDVNPPGSCLPPTAGDGREPRFRKFAVSRRSKAVVGSAKGCHAAPAPKGGRRP